jgi:hypothetical protein
MAIRKKETAVPTNFSDFLPVGIPDGGSVTVDSHPTCHEVLIVVGNAGA